MFNFVNPYRDLAFDIALNEGVCANSCSKVPFPFRSDGHARPLEECFCFLEVAVLDYEPGLGGIGVVAIIRANFGDAIPPSLETSEISSGCGIISKPDLLVYSVFKAMDEWCDGNCIHRHGKWVSLGGAFLGEKDFSVNEQLNIFSIGVGEDLGESRTELVDIPDGCLSIQRIKSIGCINEDDGICVWGFKDFPHSMNSS